MQTNVLNAFLQSLYAKRFFPLYEGEGAAKKLIPSSFIEDVQKIIEKHERIVITFADENDGEVGYVVFAPREFEWLAEKGVDHPYFLAAVDEAFIHAIGG